MTEQKDDNTKLTWFVSQNSLKGFPWKWFGSEQSLINHNKSHYMNFADELTICSLSLVNCASCVHSLQTCSIRSLNHGFADGFPFRWQSAVLFQIYSVLLHFILFCFMFLLRLFCFGVVCAVLVLPFGLSPF